VLTVLIVSWGARIRVGLASAAALALLAGAPPAQAASMQVQPDGKIVVLGDLWPPFGAIARLQPDGALDPGFGQGGFVVDHRVPSFQALTLQPDGRVLDAAAGGSQIARYLPDGTPDPSFGGGGLAGADEPDQPQFRYSDYGPAAVLVRPDGSIVVGGTRSLGAGEGEASIRRYDAAGNPLETVGRIPRGQKITSSSLGDLIEAADGSLLGAGSSYEASVYQTLPLLARFLPGSGTDFDPGFGGGAGLARPTFGTGEAPAIFHALALSGDGLLAAGQMKGTFLLARFKQSGELDQSFGAGGFVDPPIVGPTTSSAGLRVSEFSGSTAAGLAVMGDGDVVLAGGTSQWGTWTLTKAGPFCTQCPQPMLARFKPNGELDPGFGSGGLLHLSTPDGSTIEGAVEQVEPLADGKVLISGLTRQAAAEDAFVARLNPDGSYDPTFGDHGLAVLGFPCNDPYPARQRAAGCLPSAVVTTRMRGLHSRHPSFSLQLRSSLPWAALRKATLYLPPGMRLAKGFGSKLHVSAVGGWVDRWRVHGFRTGHGRAKTALRISRIGRAGEVRVTLGRGGLEDLRARLRRHKPAFRVEAGFTPAGWSIDLGSQVVRRRAG
jgi:uncharacterized delta-60 repeat protein